MAQFIFKGNKYKTAGELPKIGQKAPDFTLVKTDLSSVSLSDFKGKKLILNIFPSIDTPTCQASTRKFNEEATKLIGVTVLCVSKDLPFAHSRFCGAEGLKAVIPASQYQDSKFSQAYGVEILDGPLKGLFSRSVVVIDEKGNVIYTELVPDIANEPNYKAALNALKAPVKA